MGEQNGNGFQRKRLHWLFWLGAYGLFLYLIMIEIFDRVFHYEFLIAFLAMMGVSITQGFDKK